MDETYRCCTNCGNVINHKMRTSNSSFILKKNILNNIIIYRIGVGYHEDGSTNSYGAC